MKLYLSSYEIGADAGKLLSLIGNNRRVGVIANASDGFREDRRPLWVARAIETLLEIGLEPKEVDLRNYFHETAELEKELKKFGLIWVLGGNTFILRRAMFQSCFDKLIPNILKTNEVIYGGFSAGVCVLAPSLKGIHLADEPEKTPTGYNSDIIWDGLGLVDFHFVPHFRSAHRESQMMEDVIAFYKKHHMKYITAADGEAIVINDQACERVGFATAPLAKPDSIP